MPRACLYVAIASVQMASSLRADVWAETTHQVLTRPSKRSPIQLVVIICSAPCTRTHRLAAGVGDPERITAVTAGQAAGLELGSGAAGRGGVDRAGLANRVGGVVGNTVAWNAPCACPGRRGDWHGAKSGATQCVCGANAQAACLAPSACPPCMHLMKQSELFWCTKTTRWRAMRWK